MADKSLHFFSQLRTVKTTELNRYSNAEVMSPTILREKGYRFFFFSREEARMHVHVYFENGEAQFWIEPEIELERNYRLSRLQPKQIESIIEEHYHEFKTSWQAHFGS
jgi:hypothetical protein